MMAVTAAASASDSPATGPDHHQTRPAQANNSPRRSSAGTQNSNLGFIASFDTDYFSDSM